MNFKNIFISFFVLNMVCLSSFALSNEEFLSKAEKELYDTEFSFEQPKLRLNRIERTVLGQAMLNKSTNDRIAKLKNIFENTEIIKPPQSTQVATSPVSKDEKYPVVEDIENKVFGKVFLSENIYSRLNRLEFKLFKQQFADSLTDRVDRLKTIVLSYQPPKLASNQSFDMSSVSSADSIQKELYNMEMKVYKKSYLNDTTSSRLGRLEQYFFSTASNNMNDKDRLERLVAVVDAKENQPASDALVQASKASRWGSVAAIAGVVLMIALSALSG